MGDLVPVQVVLKLAEADTLAAGEVGTAWARLLVGVFDADMEADVEGGVTVGDLGGDVETVLERLVVEVAVAVVAADDGAAPLHRPNPGFKRRGGGQQNLEASSSFSFSFEK